MPYTIRIRFNLAMTTLIKNILLIDGSGQPAVKADVLVKNEKIAAIGSFPRYQADTVIDGIGAYLAPGFIDIDTHSDRYLTIFTDPGQRFFLQQGITTIIGGQDGISLAPLLYGSLDLQKFWTDTDRINLDWHTVGEFLEVLRRRDIGVNFGTLVGHSTMRHTIIGNDFRDLTQKEQSVLHYMIEQAMRNGAFGVSFDLQSPVAALTPAKEIKAALEVVERYKGLATFKLRSGSDTHVYAEDASDHFVPAVSEIINFSKETGVRAQIGNFTPLKGFEAAYRGAIEAIDANAAVADVYFNMHPFEYSILPIVSCLPVWAQRGGMDDIINNLESVEYTGKIIPELTVIPDDAVIFDAPGFDYLIGRTLREIGADRGTVMPETLLQLMRMTKLRATIMYKNLSLMEFEHALACDRSIIGSSGASFEDERAQSPHNEAFADTIQTVLRAVATNKSISLETAVRKMTSIPAQRLGIKNRGYIREGYFADLVLFRDSTIETVFVNGVAAFRDGAFAGLNGKILDHGRE